MDRRQFIKTLGTAGAGALILPGFTTSSQTENNVEPEYHSFVANLYADKENILKYMPEDDMHTVMVLTGRLLNTINQEVGGEYAKPISFEYPYQGTLEDFKFQSPKEVGTGNVNILYAPMDSLEKRMNSLSFKHIFNAFTGEKLEEDVSKTEREVLENMLRPHFINELRKTGGIYLPKVENVIIDTSFMKRRSYDRNTAIPVLGHLTSRGIFHHIGLGQEPNRGNTMYSIANSENLLNYYKFAIGEGINDMLNEKQMETIYQYFNK